MKIIKTYDNKLRKNFLKNNTMPRRHNELYRKRYTIAGEFIDEEYITENHALMMYSPFLENSTDVSLP